MKIIICPDVPNWAFDGIANAIIKYNPEIEFYKTYDRNLKNLTNRLQSFDIIYIMSWLKAANYGSHFRKRISVTTGIFSHNFEYSRGHNLNSLFREWVKGVTTSSRILFDKISIYKPKLIQYTPIGVHDDRFIPTKKERKNEFIVGWCGQPTSGRFPPNRPIDIKGYNHVLKPLINKLKKYKNITFKVLANTFDNAVPHEKMPAWYKDVDVQICTSISEGGPNPMFEAASCGISLISTNVGRISEFITPGENGFIVPSYSCEKEIPKTLDEFERRILQLKNDRDLCDQMGKNNREKIEKEWSWKEKAKAWKTFFEGVIKNGR